MTKFIRTIFHISRWRFWLYLGGTYAVGYAHGAKHLDQFTAPYFWLNLAFFLLPANLFLYGVNDLFDRETDLLNPKKSGTEHLLRTHELSKVAIVVTLCGILGVALAFTQNVRVGLLIAAFLALSVFYSAPPLRLKARPFWDSASNILYAVPGFIGYLQASGQMLSWRAIAVCGAWTAAMHLYSAIPDIESDAASGIKTTATLLGHRNSLILCTALWAVFAYGAINYSPLGWWGWLALIYPLSSMALAFRDPSACAEFYWRFPIINGVLGMVAFFVLMPRS